jgi:hypothetical protein
MVSIDVFRSQTAEHVVEVYRRGITEYGVPKEVLTDNGRQYSNWRGTTRFAQELKKDNVFHIKSQPHHPMTLGKIERFWKTVFEEFLSRAQFDDFDNARERLKLWVKYYNYKRPHQGIEGLCPADRFFEIQNELRKTMEKGIAENTLEMALRGKPKVPFYIVGRLGSQEVALRAEKGRLSMVIDDPKEEKVQEVIYDIMKGAENGDNQEGKTQGHHHGTEQGRGGVVDMDAAVQAGGDLQGAECPVGNGQPMAGAGYEGHAGGAGTAAEFQGRGNETPPAVAEAVQPAGPGTPAEISSAEAGRALEQAAAGEARKENTHRRQPEELKEEEHVWE